MFDVIKFLKEYGINNRARGANCSPGFVNINCPFCKQGDNNYHGGFQIEKGYYTCWKCGWHPISEVIIAILKCTEREAINLYKKYSDKQSYKAIQTIKKESEYNNINYAKMIDCRSFKSTFNEIYLNYLKHRNFDPYKVIKQFNLLSGGLVGDYKFRIIAPIYFKNELVSFQGRDITDKQKLRYKACRKKDEIIFHKRTLYNLDNCNDNKVIVCEGITDVWRLGDNTCCTFGVQFSTSQVLLLAEKFKKVFILYDPDPAGKKQGKILSMQLAGLGLDVEIIAISDSDPGSMSDTNALLLKKDLFRKRGR
jgi:hypothetical protein